ncbi:ABC transporter ATP-binding protein [Alicyclobacillus macrosporangiidus]|uniref:ABC transporter ATP-binding protein n=1 Tax=Alicyclobacillus macrosporangiidus TaxID=392015 RepID=UPI00068B6A00|nr:ABC transporter ATP-binding protein [Alicyclobacillus macrosporangiidus]
MLLDMNDIRIDVKTLGGWRNLVDVAHLHVEEGESVGVVGETGSGKTLTSLAVTRLFPSPAIRLNTGSVRFRGVELSKLSAPELERLRGREIGMVFQDPSTSLNPVFRIGKVLTDLVRTHHKVGKREAVQRSLELLQRVELPDPERLFYRYPFELSGGQRQRVLIAMALAGRPRLLIADEPTTALDVTVQAGILLLLKRLQQEEGLAMLLITHNMGLVAHMTQRVYVMYRGRVVESGRTSDVLVNPRHPYTRMLIQSIPRWSNRGQALATWGHGASAASAASPPAGSHSDAERCAFAGRCPVAGDECWLRQPALTAVPGVEEHQVACFRWEDCGVEIASHG